MKEFKFNPIRRILVPTDFSANAMGALHYAASLALRLRSKLILFHAIHVPVTVGTEASLIDNEPLLLDMKVRLDALKQDLFVKYPGVDVEVSTAYGFAVEEIIGNCESSRADLIVMGTKGVHGLAGALIGSNTAEVIARSTCPTLAVPSDAVSSDMEKIIFATNYSDHDFQSLFLLTEIFKPWNPEIVVVHVAEPMPREERKQLEWFESQVKASISYDKFSFTLLEGEIEKTLSEFAEASGADLLAVSKRRRSLFERLVSRSVTRKLAYHTHLPLLAFHANAPGPAFP